MVLLVKLLVEACNFTKSSTSPWVVFTFFKLWKWYQIVQNVSYSQLSAKLNQWTDFYVWHCVKNVQINDFSDSAPVCKLHGCCAKVSSNFLFRFKRLHCVDVKKLLQEIFKRIYRFNTALYIFKLYYTSISQLLTSDLNK